MNEINHSVHFDNFFDNVEKSKSTNKKNKLDDVPELNMLSQLARKEKSLEIKNYLGEFCFDLTSNEKKIFQEFFKLNKSYYVFSKSYYFLCKVARFFLWDLTSQKRNTKKYEASDMIDCDLHPEFFDHVITHDVTTDFVIVFYRGTTKTNKEGVTYYQDVLSNYAGIRRGAGKATLFLSEVELPAFQEKSPFLVKATKEILIDNHYALRNKLRPKIDKITDPTKSFIPSSKKTKIVQQEDISFIADKSNYQSPLSKTNLNNNSNTNDMLSSLSNAVTDNNKSNSYPGKNKFKTHNNKTKDNSSYKSMLNKLKDNL